MRLTPHAARDELGAVDTAADGRRHLAVRVRAIAEKGKANAALEKLVAAALGLPRSSVRVSAGATQRLKTLSIEGDAGEIRSKIEKLSG